MQSLNEKTGLFTKHMKRVHRDPILRAQRIASIKVRTQEGLTCMLLLLLLLLLLNAALFCLKVCSIAQIPSFHLVFGNDQYYFNSFLSN
jgi:hypothetical protein